MLKREPYIDLVIGPQAYHKINDTILNHIKKNKKAEETEFDAISKFEYFNKIKNNSGKISSFLTIQEGCDKFCHFCVVPYTRGPEYSRPFKQILDEAKYLAESGTQEIILLGQNVNAYNNEKYRLSDLILEIEKYSDIKRIRYTTSHPKDMSDDLIEVYKYSKKLMPLVHLPVQSGSNKVLDLMNRKHTINEYYKIYDQLKKINPNIQFSSDFIIGYPGEEEEDFNATFELIQKIKFINSYSFIFSPRPGTVAADLELVDKKKSKERLEIIQKRLFENQINKNKSLEGKTLNVLVENKMKDGIKLFGRTEFMTSVIFDGNTDCIGKVMQIEITNSNQNSLFGILNENYKKKVA
jgi:tRNA-2-methylthio-N6-dimethylallyladenosine synthase